MAPRSSWAVAERKVTMRGFGPASIRRRPSAWSKSKLANMHLAQRTVVVQVAETGHQQRQVAIQQLGSRVAPGTEGAVDQHRAVGQVQVFRHALAVGNIVQVQLLAD